MRIFDVLLFFSGVFGDDIYLADNKFLITTPAVGYENNSAWKFAQLNAPNSCVGKDMYMGELFIIFYIFFGSDFSVSIQFIGKIY